LEPAASPAFAVGLFGLSYLSLAGYGVNGVWRNEHFRIGSFQRLHERPALLYSVAMLPFKADNSFRWAFSPSCSLLYYGRANVPYSIKNETERK